MWCDRNLPVKLTPPTPRSGNPAPHRAKLECPHRRHVLPATPTMRTRLRKWWCKDNSAPPPEMPSLLDPAYATMDSRHEPWLWPTETRTSSSLQTTCLRLPQRGQPAWNGARPPNNSGRGDCNTTPSCCAARPTGVPSLWRAHNVVSTAS